jgi:hypothetical protein
MTFRRRDFPPPFFISLDRFAKGLYMLNNFSMKKDSTMTVRADQKEERRQAIIEAGLELFVRRGYAGTRSRT